MAGRGEGDWVEGWGLRAGGAGRRAARGPQRGQVGSGTDSTLLTTLWVSRPFAEAVSGSQPGEPGLCPEQTLGGAGLFGNLAEFTPWEGVVGGGARFGVG